MSHKPLLLLVDDELLNLNVLIGFLKHEYDLVVSKNGHDALKKVRDARRRPDLILLDIMMPIMDGYEVCKELKADPSTSDIPIIFVTALTEYDQEAKGFELGAVDYIGKPFNIQVVKARVKYQVELHRAKRQLLIQKQHLELERETIEGTLTRMRDAFPLDSRHLRYLISPVEKTSGDILLNTVNAENVHYYLLGDFTGHGLSAAIGGPLVANLFRSGCAANDTPEKILGDINQALCLQLPTNMFMAACLVEWNPAQSEISVWNAGLPEQLLLTPNGIQERCYSSYMPLGIVPDEQYQQRSGPYPFDSESSLVCFSDGLIEVTHPESKEMFGMERFTQWLNTYYNSPTPSLPTLLTTLSDFNQHSPFDDDVSIAIISALPVESEES